MSLQKKQIRAAFLSAVFERDLHRCVMCGKSAVDAHHITDRSIMPGGGYVEENGIALCAECHELAEYYHTLGEAYPGYSPSDLYDRINSSYNLAYQASLKLTE